MSGDLTILQQKLGINFNDLSLLDLALTHRSHGLQSYERLEFLGDSILNYIIAAALFKKYPDADEGQLSYLRSNLVNGTVLAEMAREFRFGDYLRLGAGELKTGGAERSSILADSLEAIIGAIYLDSNIDVCNEIILTWFESRLNEIKFAIQKDAKTRLQELLQAKKLPLPEYDVINTVGKAHEHIFTVSCKVSSLNFTTTGKGVSRRSAEQIAAKKFLEKVLQK